MSRKLKHSRFNRGTGISGDAQANAEARASDIAQATAGAETEPLGEGTTPLSFEERAEAKRRIQTG